MESPVSLCLSPPLQQPAFAGNNHRGPLPRCQSGLAESEADHGTLRRLFCSRDRPPGAFPASHPKVAEPLATLPVSSHLQ